MGPVGPIKTPPVTPPTSTTASDIASFGEFAVGDGTQLTGWADRQEITVDSALVSGTDQTNFPVLVNITNANLAAHALASGFDITFTAADGATVLPYEREEYNSTTGALVAWVKVPILSHTANTVLYMYYGNCSATDQQQPHSVWDANYKAVWHLKEATGTDPADSTVNGNNFTGATSPTPTQSGGQIDGCLSFNGSEAYYIGNANCSYSRHRPNNGL